MALPQRENCYSIRVILSFFAIIQARYSRNAITNQMETCEKMSHFIRPGFITPDYMEKIKTVSSHWTSPKEYTHDRSRLRRRTESTHWGIPKAHTANVIHSNLPPHAPGHRRQARGQRRKRKLFIPLLRFFSLTSARCAYQFQSFQLWLEHLELIGNLKKSWT